MTADTNEDGFVATRFGGCRCGAVRYELRGEPSVVGLCHCTDCRKETGSAFLAYADWPRNAIRIAGEFSTFQARSFCSVCGSRLFHLSEEHAEICVGSLDDAPTGLRPAREGWIIRREHWLNPLEDTLQAETDPEPSTVEQHAGETSEIGMIKRKLQETAVRAHSTDQSKPPAVEGERRKQNRADG
ncbi:MAG: glutathione-dependent formaldehyde-activating [Devosia sp.]|uniref:GFA family protein n=1 Tax=Devosia sp. TaxID=1871048 RepID=UPI002A72D5DC|nr:glutathione-dependent formaldehyde-activating [Devosia sp.]